MSEGDVENTRQWVDYLPMPNSIAGIMIQIWLYLIVLVAITWFMGLI